MDKIVAFLGSYVNDKDREIRIWITIIYAVVMSGLFFGLVAGRFVGLIFGLLAGILAAVLLPFEPITAVEVLRIKRPKLRSWAVKFGQGVLVFLLSGLIVSFFGRESGGIMGEWLFIESGLDLLIMKPVVESLQEPSTWIVFGVILGLLASVTTFVQPQEIEKKSQPNQGVRSSVKNAFRMLIALTIILGGVGLLLGIVFFRF